MKEEINIVADITKILERLNRMEETYGLIQSKVSELEELVSNKTKEKLSKI